MSTAFLLVLLLNTFTGAASEAPKLTGIIIEVSTVPTPLHTQRGIFLLYELHITNLRSNSLELNRVEILSASSFGPIAVYEPPYLDRWINRHVPLTNKRLIDGGQRAVLFINLPLKAKDFPPTLRQRLIFQSGSGKELTEECELSIQSESPNSVAPPVSGGNWCALNSLDSHSHHRMTWFPVAGRPVVPQRYAIDWIKLGPNNKPFHGDPRQLTNYYGYGLNVVAAGNATVSQVRDGMPDNLPFKVDKTSVSLDASTGNHVLLRIDSTHYALYAHLQPGSIAVKPGDRVKTGQMLGRLGNSGSSDIPHLHFHMVDSDSAIFADGIPYQLKAFEWRGVADSLDALMEGRGFAKSYGESSNRRSHEFPINNAVVDFR